MAAQPKKPLAIYAAMAGNFAVAIAKFTVALFTGSSAMLSEGIHSVVDTGNQGLFFWAFTAAESPRMSPTLLVTAWSCISGA